MSSKKFFKEHKFMVIEKPLIKSQGFTLMELLIVMAIIGLLATLVAPGIIKQFGGAQYDAESTYRCD